MHSIAFFKTALCEYFLLGDQLANAKLAKRHDFIVDLDWNTVTEDELLDAINEVLKNPKYIISATDLKLY